MLAFYQRLFPFRYLFQWLNHSMKPSNDFGHREFAFTLQNDAYLRYQSFATSDLFVIFSASTRFISNGTTVYAKIFFVSILLGLKSVQSTRQILETEKFSASLQRSGL